MLYISSLPQREILKLREQLLFTACELLTQVREDSNVDGVVNQLMVSYSIDRVERDYKVRKKRAPLSAESRMKISRKVSAYRKGRKWSEEVKQKISNTMKGKGNHNVPHDSIGKQNIRNARKKWKPCLGLKWYHDPLTGEERLFKDNVPEGWVRGRGIDPFHPED
jgi:hypothetical protein